MNSDTTLQGNDGAIYEETENIEILSLKAAMRKLYNVWQAFGIDASQKSQRAKIVWVHIQNLLKDILEEETTFYNDIKERIDNYKVKIKELSNVLSITPKEVSESCLIKEEEILRQELDNLSKLKHKRIKVYQDMKAVELQYCQVLSLKAHQLPPNTGVPSEQDLNELQQHIDMLKEEKERRHIKFCKAKKELTTIWETTELTPESSLEKEILSGKENFSLSNETFKALEEVISKAQQRKAELEAERKALLEQLTALWKRLRVDESKKVHFLSQHVDCRLSTVKSIKQELERCQKIKKENIKMFVISLRQELDQLWNKCYVSHSVREQFKYFTSDEMTDEVLEAHETEVEKWNKYYKDAENILKKITKRQELWELMIVFESKACDPNRFKNRKGGLLQEERERKKLQKDLPALENSIFQDIEIFEAEKGCPFLYYGEDFRKFVTNQWTERISQKENEKIQRHQLHLQQLGNITGTPGKRPLMTTPKSAPSKLLKSSVGASMFRTPGASSSKVIPSTMGKSITKSARLFTNRPNTIQRKDHKLILKERNQCTATPHIKSSPNGTTYTEFATELNKSVRHNLRSSVLATRKPGGTRISINNSRSKRKSAAKPLRKSMRNTSTNAPGLTPARGKLGLPFLI